MVDTATLLRNAPVQARSTARLTSLLDAAAAVVDESGYERLTTAMVAERAGSSIGTVYRYFPDRIAVLQALSARALEDFVGRSVAGLPEEVSADPVAALDSVVDALVTAFRTEPGFRSLRFGDVLDLRPHPDGRTAYGTVAEAVTRVIAVRRGEAVADHLAFDVEVALHLADALLARAFAVDPAGDERFVDAARAAVRRHLEGSPRA